MIVFVSVFINHHQYPVAQELYKITNGDYRYIELTPMPEPFKNAGYKMYSDLPFLIKSWKSIEERKRAEDLILNADVVIYGIIDTYKNLYKRLSAGKLTFTCGERWLKKGLVNLLSPRLLKSQILYHTLFYDKPLYNLCASAFAVSDFKLLHSYKNKCFKWGYFTEIPAEMNKNIGDNATENYRFVSIGRLIDWKRHDLTIRAAKLLVDKGIDLIIDIFGSGHQESNLISLIKSLGLENHVFLKGNLDNAELIGRLHNYQALIFPSSRQEGWGAVVNEAMAHGCPVIGSNEAGSVPYLIEDGINGFIFQSGNYVELSEKMTALISSDELRNRLARNAYRTVRDIWSPQNAAKNLLQLINAINTKSGNYPSEGPCSPAQ